MKMKTCDLIGPALDWAVAAAEQGYTIGFGNGRCYSLDDGVEVAWEPSTDWAQGGPIIERESIPLTPFIDHRGRYTWRAGAFEASYEGSTPLVAAMRCYVASVMGDEIEIPEELV